MCGPGQGRREGAGSLQAHLGVPRTLRGARVQGVIPETLDCKRRGSELELGLGWEVGFLLSTMGSLLLTLSHLVPIVPGTQGWGLEAELRAVCYRARGGDYSVATLQPSGWVQGAGGAGLPAQLAQRCRSAQGGARVKRKGVEGRTRTPPLCGASSGVAVSGVGIPKGAG